MSTNHRNKEIFLGDLQGQLSHMDSSILCLSALVQGDFENLLSPCSLLFIRTLCREASV